MPQYTSIRRFPDEWGKNARCPVCKNNTMLVTRFAAAADQFRCPICCVSFEVEEKGEHIFFTETPAELALELSRQWVSRQQLAEVLEKRRFFTDTRQFSLPIKPAQPKGNPARAEAVRRARKLVELGNSPAVIHKSLSESMRLADFAIEEIITDAVNVHKMKRREKNKKYFIFFGIAVVFLIAVFGVLSWVL
jgi:hypothetical protein